PYSCGCVRTPPDTANARHRQAFRGSKNRLPPCLDSRFGECLDCPRIVDPASGPSSEATCSWIRRLDYCSLALVGHLVAPAGAFVFQAFTCHRGWAMSIVAISETAGSMGIEIGRKLAESLGWEFAGREIRPQAAEQFGEDEAALNYVRHSDRERAARVKFLYQLDVDDPLLYDLVLNTERLTVEKGAGLIRETLRDERFQSIELGRREVVDRSLAALARAALM